MTLYSLRRGFITFVSYVENSAKSQTLIRMLTLYSSLQALLSVLEKGQIEQLPHLTLESDVHLAFSFTQQVPLLQPSPFQFRFHRLQGSSDSATLFYSWGIDETYCLPFRFSCSQENVYYYCVFDGDVCHDVALI